VYLASIFLSSADRFRPSPGATSTSRDFFPFSLLFRSRGLALPSPFWRVPLPNFASDLSLSQGRCRHGCIFPSLPPTLRFRNADPNLRRPPSSDRSHSLSPLPKVDPLGCMLSLTPPAFLFGSMEVLSLSATHALRSVSLSSCSSYLTHSAARSIPTVCSVYRPRGPSCGRVTS